MKGIKLGTIVHFRSEGRSVIGTVIKMECGLYGILSEGVDGLYWRDARALIPIRFTQKRHIRRRVWL
jgi:hypothetical protein